MTPGQADTADTAPARRPPYDSSAPPYGRGAPPGSRPMGRRRVGAHGADWLARTAPLPAPRMPYNGRAGGDQQAVARHPRLEPARRGGDIPRQRPPKGPCGLNLGSVLAAPGNPCTAARGQQLLDREVDAGRSEVGRHAASVRRQRLHSPQACTSRGAGRLTRAPRSDALSQRRQTGAVSVV